MLIRNTLKYVWARGLSAIINFLALAIFTRLLTPEQYGQYALVIAAVSLTNTVLFQWIRLGLLRFSAAHEGDRAGFASTILVAYVRAALLAIAIGVVVWVVAPPATTRSLVLIGVGILLAQAWFEINLDTAVSRIDSARYGRLSQTRAITGLVVGSLCAATGFGAAGTLLGVLSGFVIAPLLFGQGQWAGVQVGAARRDVLGEFLRYGIPLTAVYALDFIVSTSDRFLLKLLIDNAAAGLYAAAYDLTQQSLGMLMMIINLAAFPLAVRALEAGGRKAAEPQLRQHATLLLAVALPSALMFALLREDLAGTLLGSEFRADAALLIPVVALAALVGGMKAFYFDLSFQLGRATRPLVVVVGVAAVVNVLLNLWWIPVKGAMGAAYSTLAAYVVGLALSWLLGRKVLPLPIPWLDWGRITLASAGTAAAVYLIPLEPGLARLLVRATLGAGVYALLVLALDVAGVRVWLRGRRDRSGGTPGAGPA